VPWVLYLAYVRALFPCWAMERLNTAAAIQMALITGSEAPSIWRQTVREAYPKGP
jgi:hypothetical protein